MIEKLTKEQEKKAKVYLKNGEAIGYRTKTVDKKKATKVVHFLYEKIMKIKKPKYVIFLDSPMACQLACNLIKNSKSDSNQLYNQLYNQLENQLDNQLYNQLYDQLDNQLRTQLDNQLVNQLDNQLRNQLENQLENQLDNQLYDQLYNQLYNQLENQLDTQKLEYFYAASNNLYWTGYYEFYNFILNELLPKERKNFKLFQEYLGHHKEIHMSYMFPEIVFISDFPKAIHTNERHQLHNYNKPALEYRDTYALYRSNGIQMDKEQILTPANEITKEQFLKETNVDKRRELSRKIGIEKTIEMLGAEVVDTYNSKVGGKYELLLVDFDNRGDKRPYLKMQNPSLKDVYHIEGIAPGIKTVKEAIMFRNGLKEFIEPKVLS